jgi:hypothetical protein
MKSSILIAAAVTLMFASLSAAQAGKRHQSHAHLRQGQAPALPQSLT